MLNKKNKKILDDFVLNLREDLPLKSFNISETRDFICKKMIALESLQIVELNKILNSFSFGTYEEEEFYYKLKELEKEIYGLLERFSFLSNDFESAYKYQKQYHEMDIELLSKDIIKNKNKRETEIYKRLNDELLEKNRQLEVAYENLSASEAQVKSVFDNAVAGIGIVDKSGDYIMVNKTWSRIFGYNEDEVKNLSDIDTIYHDDLEDLRSYFKKLLSGSIDRYNVEKRFIRKNGDVFWGDMSVSAVKDKSNKVIHIIGVIADINDRKKAEEALLKSKKDAEKAMLKAKTANKAKSLFLANMSHEIRTPLNSIIGYSRILTKSDIPEKEKEYVDIISRSGRNLLSLINDILDLSKVESGRITLSLKSIDVKSLFDEILSIFAIKIKEKKLDFSIDIDDSVPRYIIHDEVRLRQVLFNVIGNAVKFTESGYIKVTVKYIDRDLKVVVEDTGAGIKKDNFTKIFDAFIQQDDQGSKYGGTGLGLTITKRLLEIMNGEIFVDSEIGKGSTFTIVLKNVREGIQDLKQLEKYEESLRVRFKKSKILLIDDDYENVKIIESILSKYNIEVITAVNFNMFCENIEKYYSDVIIISYDLYNKTTSDLKSCVKQNFNNKTIPTIILDGKKSITDFNCRFDICIKTPVDESELISALKKILEFSEVEASFEKRLNNMVATDHVEFSSRMSEKTYKKFQNDLISLEKFWENNKSMLILDKWSSFSEMVTECGNKYGIGILPEYGRYIKMKIDYLNLGDLKKLIDIFPLIKSKIKRESNVS